jgi:hypothetical protein
MEVGTLVPLCAINTQSRDRAMDKSEAAATWEIPDQWPEGKKA